MRKNKDRFGTNFERLNIRRLHINKNTDRWERGREGCGERREGGPSTEAGGPLHRWWRGEEKWHSTPAYARRDWQTRRAIHLLWINILNLIGKISKMWLNIRKAELICLFYTASRIYWMNQLLWIDFSRKYIDPYCAVVRCGRGG